MNDDFKPTVTVRWPVTVCAHYHDGSVYDRVRRVTLQPGERLEKRRTTLTIVGPPWQDIALDRLNGDTILFDSSVTGRPYAHGSYERSYQCFLDERVFEEDGPACTNDHLIRKEDRP